MKKVLLVLFIGLLIFLGLSYWSVSILPEEIRISEISSSEAVDRENLEQVDSVTVLISNLYEGSTVKNFMQGTNYRKAWSAPVKMPVLFLDSLEVVEEGGGKQTHSLKLRAANNIMYTLRSVNKDPEPLIPPAARRLALENIIVDGISAQHPYAAILAAELADAAGVLHTHPKMFYVPEQKALGKFAKDYGNKAYLLEYETEGETNWTNLENVVEIMDTDDLQELKLEHPEKVEIDKSAFVRARLFDLLIGDWDRHAKQWGWVVQKSADNYIAIPLAGDRDNAFFRIDGVLPTMLTNKLIQPLVRPFEKDIDHLPGLVYPVDVYFLKSTPEEIFISEAKAIQQLLTDEKIDKAFQAWPKKLREFNAEEIAEKLKSRRDGLAGYAVDFKKIIDEKELLKKPLKGSEELQLPEALLKCFDCE